MALQEWQRLCDLSDIPEGGSRGFSEQRLFALRQGNRVFVYRNQCPHLGIPLEWVEHQFLDPSGSMIQCANHAALFVVDSGQCVAGPCAGKRLTPVAHELRNQQLWVASD